jgi:cobalamin-dependent methionine synthase I
MDLIQHNLKVEMKGIGMGTTNRYSPGYCDWDITEQKKLFGLLPAVFCGISLTESMLMKPIKSISGIIGIGKEVSFKRYSCNYCKDNHCLYRNKR